MHIYRPVIHKHIQKRKWVLNCEVFLNTLSIPKSQPSFSTLLERKQGRKREGGGREREKDRQAERQTDRKMDKKRDKDGFQLCKKNYNYSM